MKKRALALLCACLLACSLPAQAVTNPPASYTAQDASYTLTCPAGWAAYDSDGMPDALRALGDEPAYLMASTFLYGNGVTESPSFLFKDGEIAIMNLMLETMSQPVTNAEMGALYEGLLDLYRDRTGFAEAPASATAPREDSRGVRWLSGSCTFSKDGTDWLVVSLLGAKGNVVIHLALLTPQATAAENQTALEAVQASLQLAEGRDTAVGSGKQTYGALQIDEALEPYYGDDRRAYVDVGECMMYAIPAEWIGLYPNNLQDELAAVTGAGKPYSQPMAKLIQDLYDGYSATILTADRTGVLVSTYFELNEMKTWKAQAPQIMAEIEALITNLDGFEQRVNGPALAEDGSVPDLLVYEYVQTIHGQKWRVLAGFIPYQAYLPSALLYTPEGTMTDALRAEFANTMHSMQAGLPLQ